MIDYFVPGSRFRKLTLFTAIMTFALVVLGGVVRVTGSGLGSRLAVVLRTTTAFGADGSHHRDGASLCGGVCDAAGDGGGADGLALANLAFGFLADRKGHKS